MPTSAQLRDRPRLEPIYLIEITLKNSGPTLYFSDRNILVDSQQYENYLKEISDIEGEIKRIDSSTPNTDITLTVKNDRYKTYNYLIEIGDTYPFEGAVCVIKEVYLDDDNNPSEAATIFKGVLDEPQEIDLLNFQCSVSSMMFQKDRQWEVKIIDKTTYPNAYEEVGKVEPIIYGSDILVPSIRTDWGARTTLKAVINSTQTTGIELSDSSRFPASGTILMDSEEISYTSIASNVLAGVTRGVNGTTATGHSAGATIWEKQAQYDSLLAGHELHSIDNIYAEINGEFWRVTSGVAGLLSGGKHYLRATSQIKIAAVKDDINVNDTIGVNQGNHSHSVNENPVAYYGSSAGNTGSGYVEWTGTAANMRDQNLATYLRAASYAPPWGFSADMTVYFPAYSGPTPSAVYKCIHYQGSIADRNYGEMEFGGTTLSDEGYSVTKKFYMGTTPPTSLTAHIHTSSGWDYYMGNLTVYEIWYEVQASSTSVDPAAGVAKTGAASKSGSVIATNLVDRFHAVVSGYKDITGDYGGVGNIIKRPDYVFKHFLVAKLGFSLSEIDSTSFSSAGTWYGTNSYEFGFEIYDKIIPSEFIRRLACESRSTLKYIAGKWYLDIIPNTAPSVIKTISESELAGKFAKFKFNKTAIVDLANDLTAVFKRDYSKAKAIDSDWILTSKTSDATSKTKYGTYPQDFQFEYIRAQTIADSVLAHILLQRKIPFLIVSFPVFWEHYDLKEGDTFDIDNLLYDAKKFYIEKFNRLDKFRAEIEAKEWW